MSVRSEAERAATTTATSIPTAGAVAQDVQATIIAAQTADNQLDAANDLAVHSPEHPLNRFIAVSVRASLEDLCLRKNRAVWKPTAEAAAAIMKQPKFTDLSGKTEAQGDLNSVVLHKMEIQNVKSTFPVAIGANFTGVDANTFSVTGQSFGHIVLAGEASSTPRTLQEDDVSLCYEFSKKFPGYTSQNLGDKGVHEVHARKFVLVSADHPMVSAISENADKLQMGEISMMCASPWPLMFWTRPRDAAHAMPPTRRRPSFAGRRGSSRCRRGSSTRSCRWSRSKSSRRSRCDPLQTLRSASRPRSILHGARREQISCRRRRPRSKRECSPSARACPMARPRRRSRR